ncbi:MAG: glycosyltransferase [Bacteroidaceae bacterium]|nr:glycosyltransferase [Bacteroidaceae bacterium]
MLITIVTVTYNAEGTLERTLKSVEMQTHGNVEHIIMDGASKDGTLAIAQAYKERNDDRDIRIVSEPDKGLYDAMNKAIALASGEYICFLNAGDKLHNPQTLEFIVHIAQHNPDAGVIYGDTDIVDDNGMKLRERRLSPPKRLNWRSFKNGMLVCHQAFYAKRSIVPAYDLSYRFSADFDWCVRIMKKAATMSMPLVNSHLTLADYLSEGMTTANHKASLKERFAIMRKHYGLFTTLVQHAWFFIRALIKK